MDGSKIMEKCYSCYNYNKETGYCDCISFNCVGITIPDCFPNGCMYYNKKVLVPSNWCKQDTTITKENCRKCKSCLESCVHGRMWKDDNMAKRKF